MAAAENAALPRGKVGGVGDVVRDLPPALAGIGVPITVVVPEYGLFAELPGARTVGEFQTPFAGGKHRTAVIELPSDKSGVRHLALRGSPLTPQGARIYCDDGPQRPFATDAGKFAFFSAALAQLVMTMDEAPELVHLHDWHTAMYLVLRAFDPQFQSLLAIRTVFTIHNLALQGVRPLDHDASSLAAWYHDLPFDRSAVADPQHEDCINPMAAAIRLADAVSTVSPTYAREILMANDPARGFRGGENLESILSDAAAAGRLVGILNGATYDDRNYARPGWRRLMATVEQQLQEWRDSGSGPPDVHKLALERVAAVPRQRPADLVTSIGRLTDQKVSLFLQAGSDGKTPLATILDDLSPDGVAVVLGSGDPVFEQRFADLARDHENLIYLCGYSEPLADLLYRAGDLFLMPSSFEPCGISQMLAMRASQPCVAHAVGGLRDTVVHDVNGFLFDGHSPVEQAERFVETVRHALATKRRHSDRWLAIRNRAAAERFSWEASARQYVGELYARPDSTMQRTQSRG